MAYTSYTTSDTTTTGDYAARLCDIHLAGGYDDWFLPSRYELNQMYLNLQAQSVGGFSGYYWSSSEEGHLSAWLQSFSTGNQYDYGKYNDVNIRPARAFWWVIQPYTYSFINGEQGAPRPLLFREDVL